MDITHPSDAWKRLGKALELRRWQLGYPHGKRGRFVREQGSRVSYRTVARIEQGEAHDYPAATRADIEALYRLEPGSVDDFLAGGQLRPLAEQRGRYSDPRLDAIASLPAESAEVPWGFSDEDRAALMALDLGQRAYRQLQRSGVPSAGQDAPAAEPVQSPVLDEAVLAGMTELAARVSEEEPSRHRAAS